MLSNLSAKDELSPSPLFSTFLKTMSPLKWCVLMIAAALIGACAAGDPCPADGSCPDLSGHDIDLSPLQR